MPLAALAPALIPAAAGLVGSGLNAATQGSMNRKTRKWNEQMMEKQRQWSLQDWEKQNQYNSPAQQMVRLREAGLNPHLIYGGGQPTNTASAVQSTPTPSWNPKAPDVGAMLTSPVNAYLETRVFQAQQKQMAANLLKTLTEVDTKQFDLSQKERLADTQAAIMQEIATGKSIENVLNYDENIRRNLTTSQNLQQGLYNMAKTMSDIQLQEMMLQKGNEEIKNVQQMREKVQAEINNLNKDGKIKDFEIQLNKAGLTKSDPYYFRVGKTLLETLGLDFNSAKQKVDNLIKEGKEKYKIGATAVDIIQRFFSSAMGINY